jgi:ATP-dependent helicase/nuclease subunit A
MRAIRPSAAIEAPEYAEGRAAFAARREGAEAALRRGRLIHRLLEALPEQPAAGRRDIAARYLAAVAADLADDVRNTMIVEVVAILDDARFGAVFAPGSRAEIDIAGEIETGDGTAALSGRIDRLAVTDHEVLIVDYKTNRPAPASLDSVPEVYVAQLALYARILGRIYPNRTIRSALLWTDIPALMEVPPERLARAEIKAIGGVDAGGVAGPRPLAPSA